MFSNNRIASAKVAFTHNHFGIRSFELEVRDSDGKRIGTQIVPLPFLKADGITHTLNGKRQVENWANSEIGLAWLRDNYGTDVQHISQLRNKVMEESERRKLPSLTANELERFIRAGVSVFHNGGIHKRSIVGYGSYVVYKTKTSSKSMEPLSKFAKWCKGVVLPDGTTLTKGTTDTKVWEAHVLGYVQDKETAPI